MNKWAKIGIIGGVVLAFILLIYFFGTSEGEEPYVTDSWEKTYDPLDKGPYGTFVLKELLDTNGLFGNFLDLNMPLEDGLVDNEDVNDIYFYVGENSYLPDSTSEFLLDFVWEGNTAFLSTHDIPWGIEKRLMEDGEDFYESRQSVDTIQYFKFEHPSLASRRYETPYIYRNEISEDNWVFMSNEGLELYGEDTSLVLGTNTKGRINFMKVKYGYGELYFHSTPYQFTNVNMFKKDGFQYAEHMLAHIPPGRIQWDRYNLEPHYNFDFNDGEGDGSGGSDPRKSILQFILDNPPLLWASILLVVSALLFVVFKGRREQKILPATESKENTSLEYINTLASLYLQQRQHKKLIVLKEKTFINFIADHYYITSKKPDAAYIEKVAVKSQVPKEHIERIFKQFENLKGGYDVSDSALIELHQMIEQFYKKCR